MATAVLLPFCGGVPKVANAAERNALSPSDGDVVVQLSNHTLYVYNAMTMTWDPISGGGGAVDSVNGQTGVVVLDTDDIAEGVTNFYYTQARFDASLATKTTTDLAEGTNLYYTQTRFDTAFAAKTTDDLTEGVTNLYYTNERVDDDVAALIQNSVNLQWTYDDTAPSLIGLVQRVGSAGFAFWDNATSELRDISGWNYYDNTLGANVTLPQLLDNTGGRTIHNFTTSLDPTLASPTSQYNFFNIQSTIDPNSTGFAIGTGGNTMNLFSLGYSHQGTSNTGSLVISSSYSTLGNGTDPIDIAGYYGYFIFGDINANVNMSRGLQGYIFQPHVHSGATFTAGQSYSNIFNDAANIETAVDGWNSFNAGPQLAGLHNNSNYVAYNAGFQIANVSGNAGVVGVSVNGQISAPNLGTGGFRGYEMNTLIANLDQNSKAMGLYGQVTAGTAEWIGLDVSTNSVNTTGVIRGVRVSVNNSNTLDRVALEVSGRTNLNSENILTSGLSQTYCNVVGGAIVIPNATAITGTDVIGNNMAISIDTGDATSSWTAGSIVGLTTLGFVGQIVGAGTLTGAVNFCLAGFAQAHTGHIDRVNNYFSAAVPGGTGGTIGEHILFFGDLPAGPVATDNWGVRIDADIDNYFAKIAIGTSTKQVTNASVGIELDSTSRAVLVSRMTTTQKNALTALDGMEVYDSTLGQFSFREAGAWVSYLNNDPVATLTKGKYVVTNDATNASFVSGLSATSAGANAADLQSADVTFDADSMLFTIEVGTERAGLMVHADWATTSISFISDPSALGLLSDAGTGIYVSKSASSNTITVKNRLGGARDIRVKGVQCAVTLTTIWA